MRIVCRCVAFMAVFMLTAPVLFAGELPDGQYQLAVFNGPSKTIYCVVKIQKDGDKLKGEMTAPHPQLAGMKVEGIERTADELRVRINIRGDSAPFIGSAGDEQGSRGVFSVFGRTNLARLEPTDKTTLTAQSAAERLPESGDFSKAANERNPKEKVKKLHEFIEKHSDSPVVFDSYRQLLMVAKPAELGAGDVTKLAEQYAASAAKWSPKWHEETLLVIATSLTQAEMLPELALEYLEQAQKALGPNVNPAALRTVELTFATAWTQLGKFGEAEQMLVKLKGRTPADPEVSFRLGQVREKSGNLEGAIEEWLPIFTNRLVAAPLREAWLKKHGNLNGFDMKLDEIYDKQVPPLKVTKFAGRQSKSANGLVLMELFTGAMCPPCVAADVAFDALVKTYEGSEVAFLEYHMHIPGPDPMTNLDAESRFKYYGAGGTPATFFNGKTEAGGGGGLQNATKKYDEYRAAIDPKLEATTSGSLKLRVFGDGEAIKIESEISGLTGENKPLPENLKLRLAVVEEIVRYPGPNGIWQSHRVVRAMPGGPDGIAIKKDNFSGTEVVSVDDVRKTLAEYINKHEASLADSPRPYTYPAKPLKLEHLKVVAFVQDDATKEVLLVSEAPVEVQ